MKEIKDKAALSEHKFNLAKILLIPIQLFLFRRENLEENNVNFLLKQISSHLSQ